MRRSRSGAPPLLITRVYYVPSLIHVRTHNRDNSNNNYYYHYYNKR